MLLFSLIRYELQSIYIVIIMCFVDRIHELPKGCNVGYGYKAKQGWINVSFADNIETPLGMSEDDI